MNKKLNFYAIVSLFPAISFAAPLDGVAKIVGAFKGIENSLISLVFGLGLIYFFWGLVGLIRSSDKDRENAKQRMLWGIVALFVMVAIYGIIAIIGNALGIKTSTGSSGGQGGGYECPNGVNPDTLDCN